MNTTNTTNDSAQEDIISNTHNLRIGSPIPNVGFLYNGLIGNTDLNCLVAVIRKELFDENEYNTYQALSWDYHKSLLKIVDCVEGTRYVYVIFEQFESLSAYVETPFSQGIYLIYKKLLFSIAKLLQSNQVFETLKVLPELISLDAENNPRFLFYPTVGASNETFSTKYKQRYPSIRFDIGVMGYYMWFRCLPEDTDGNYAGYRPPALYANEIEVIIDRLIHDKWSRKRFYQLGHYILNTDEQAHLLARLIRNTDPRADDTTKEPAVTYCEKVDFLSSLRSKNLFRKRNVPAGTSIIPWRKEPKLKSWYQLNKTLDRSGTSIRRSAVRARNKALGRPKQNTSTAPHLLNLLRQTIMHERRDEAAYLGFFQRMNSAVTSYRVGDFMDLIHQHYPVFFILIFDKACYYLKNHTTILNKQ
jgi:hypothetical protein